MRDYGFPPFRPHPLLRSGHAQTIFGACLSRCRRAYGAVRHEVWLDDGDRLVLHDDRPGRWRPGERVALMLHGLGGSHESPYLSRISGKLNAHGVRTFRMDMRGFGAGYQLAKRPTHAGRSGDVARALQAMADACPGSPISLMGFSLGGNVVLKLVGETGACPPQNLVTAIAVSPPVDLMSCARHLRRGANWIYERAFLRGLIRHVAKCRPYLVNLDSIPFRPAPRRLIDFDDRFTAPLSGFAGAEEYYARSSAAPLLTSIRVPTLIVAAADDPIVPARVFEDIRVSSSTTLHVTRHGGHVGFFGVSGVDPDRRWLDWRILDWVMRSETGCWTKDGAPLTDNRKFGTRYQTRDVPTAYSFTCVSMNLASL